MIRKSWIWLSVLALCLQAPLVWAVPPVEGGTNVSARDGQPAMRELTGLVAKETTFQTGRPLQPKVIRSQKEALELLSAESVAEFNKQVDLSKDSVVLFAWRGSGQDRLKASHQNHLVLFSLEPGRTKDLREHVKAYAIGKNVHWAIGVSWDEVKSLILKDRVRHAMQLHNRRVTISTLEGIHYEATEPKLDDIIQFIRDNKKDIPIATE